MISLATLLQDVGAFFGIFTFTVLATRLGRRFSLACRSWQPGSWVTFVFLTLKSASQAYWMTPLIGFTTLSVFGGYAIYFPEIFPTRLRSTGTGLCYNSARVFTAAILFLSTPMLGLFGKLGFASPFRASTIALASVFLIGIIVLIWAPETKDRPLPEDETRAGRRPHRHPRPEKPARPDPAGSRNSSPFRLPFQGLTGLRPGAKG